VGKFLEEHGAKKLLNAPLDGSGGTASVLNLSRVEVVPINAEENGREV